MREANNNIDNIIEGIKSGNEDLYLDLWNSVERFIRIQAEQFARKAGRQDSIEDMMQESFLILYEAVDYYDPDKKKSFIGVLATYFLPKAFNIACYGGRSPASLKDPLNDYTSLYTPASLNEETDVLLIDTIIDTNSEEYYRAIENDDFCRSLNKYLRQGIKALRDPECERLLLFMLDHNVSYGKAYECKVLKRKTRAQYRDTFERARRKIIKWMRSQGRQESIKNGIHNYLYSNRLYQSGLTAFRNNNYTSQTELMALELYEREKNLKTAENVKKMLLKG